MKVYSIDLYDYFKIDKPEGAEGILSCYLHDPKGFSGELRMRPAMIAIPGGGYTARSPREGEIVAMQFFVEDYQGFTLAYSVAPCRFPTALREAAMAVIYIRENAQALGVNADQVAAVGFSAGGHLCATLGTMFDSSELDILKGKGISARPDAILLGYPVITYLGKSHRGSFSNLCGEDEALRRRLSAETLVTENSSPAFIFHTAADNAVPVQNSLLMASAYEAKGVPFSLHIFERGNHGLALGKSATIAIFNDFGDYSKDFEKWVPLSMRWLAERGFGVRCSLC